ncbi:MAG: phosphatidate cytidylyltransferase [Bacteroidales bacterium]
MRNLLVRTISGIILVLIIIGSILLSEFSMLALILVIYSLGLYEFNAMFPRKSQAHFLLFLIAGIGLLTLSFLYFNREIKMEYLAVAAAIYFILLILFFLFLNGVFKNHTRQMLFAFYWLTGTLLFFMTQGWINNKELYDPLYMIILLSMIWIYDIGAFIFGSLLGRTPLAPLISPGKTVEGFICGVLMNAAAGYIAFRITGDFTMGQWILLSVVISVGGTAGDLFESKLKRVAGVKDSGQIIPGHGGILDRFDSLFFSAPLFLITMEILKLL